MSEALIIGLATVILSATSSMVLVNWRLAALEKKVDQHNQYSDKIANIEKDIAVMKTGIEYIKDRIDNA